MYKEVVLGKHFSSKDIDRFWQVQYCKRHGGLQCLPKNARGYPSLKIYVVLSLNLKNIPHWILSAQCKNTWTQCLCPKSTMKSSRSHCCQNPREYQDIIHIPYYFHTQIAWLYTLQLGTWSKRKTTKKINPQPDQPTKSIKNKQETLFNSFSKSWAQIPKPSV